MMALESIKFIVLSLLIVATSQDVRVKAQSFRRQKNGAIKRSSKLPTSRVRGIKGARSVQSIVKGMAAAASQDRTEVAASAETVSVSGGGLSAETHSGSILTANDRNEGVEGVQEFILMPGTSAPDTDDGIVIVADTIVPTMIDTSLEAGDTGIIGGSAASTGEFPFYVKFEGGTLCGGSLISPDTVLTAAHCVDDGPPRQVRIGPSTYYGGILVDTECAVSHDDFVENDKTLMNDVAIVKLKNPIQDTSMLIPINGDTSYPGVSGTVLTVIGFGLTSNSGGDVATTLQKLDTEFVTIDDCIDTYSEKVVTPESHICADVRAAGDCNGDSGGPVFDQNKVQVGIVSFGYGGCASNQYQDVYVNIANFAEWIVRHAMGDNCKPFTGDLPQPGSDGSGSDSGGTGSGSDSGGGTGVESEAGTDVEPEDEPATELDAFLNCFAAGIELLQALIGSASEAGIGGGGDGGGGGGGGGGKGNQAGKGSGKGFFRTIVGNVIDGVGDVLGGSDEDNGDGDGGRMR